MSKTHTGDVTNAAKRVARWLVDQAKGAGRPTTEAELQARVSATCKKFNELDRAAIEMAALVFFKRDDRVGYDRMINHYAGNGDTV